MDNIPSARIAYVAQTAQSCEFVQWKYKIALSKCTHTNERMKTFPHIHSSNKEIREYKIRLVIAIIIIVIALQAQTTVVLLKYALL